MTDEPKIRIAEEGGHRYRTVDGDLHSDGDEPAFVYADGTKWWYRQGKIHRDNAPAVIWHNGVDEWFQNGERHRDDGPAVSFPDAPDINHDRRGVREWWQRGKLMRWEAPPKTRAYLTELEALRQRHFGG